MKEPIKILFVCHGNICRSPMAEFVMKDLVAKNFRQNDFLIASAATSTEELGNPVYPPARRIMAQHGLDCHGKYARQITAADYSNYDYLIGMDTWNIRNIMRIIGDDPEEKVHKLLSFADSSADIEDPWYTGDFETTYQDVLRGCEGLLDAIL